MRIIQILIFFVYTLSAYCMPKDTVPSCIQQADIANRLSAKYNYLQENAVSASPDFGNASPKKLFQIK